MGIELKVNRNSNGKMHRYTGMGDNGNEKPSEKRNQGRVIGLGEQWHLTIRRRLWQRGRGLRSLLGF